MKQSDIQVTAINPERWGDDLDVVNAARVSFNKESDYARNWAGDPDGVIEKDEKLIKYLAKHKHFSPFNHSFITMRIKAPIFVARQLVKHRFMPWNEVSRRYVDEEPEFYIPPEGWRSKAANVKQGSGHVFGPREFQDDLSDRVEKVIIHSLDTYEDLMNSGVCAEQARMVLPQNMMTEWIWSGTLGAWCDMLRLRLDPHTQYESRIVAQQARSLIEPIFPISVKALLD